MLPFGPSTSFDWKAWVKLALSVPNSGPKVGVPDDEVVPL